MGDPLLTESRPAGVQRGDVLGPGDRRSVGDPLLTESRPAGVQRGDVL